MKGKASKVDKKHKHGMGSLKGRLQKSYDDKDKGGMGNPAFDWKKAGEIKFYKVKEGKNRINIVPYIIKTKNHPLVKSGDYKIGDPDYLMDVYIHRYIGPTQSDIICPKRTYNKPCPICEQADKARAEGKEKEFSSLRARRTVYYNVIDARNPDEGLQVFAVSHYLFEKELIDEARNASDNGEIIDFPDINDGMEISFRAAKAVLNKQEFFEYKSFAFVPRDEPLDEDLVDQAVSFDDIMKLYSYEEIEKMLYGGTEEDEEDESSNSEEEEEEEDEGDSDEEEEEENEEEDEDSDEEEEDEEDDEEEDDEEEDDEEEESEEDKPTPKKDKKTKVVIGKKPPAAKTKGAKEIKNKKKVKPGTCPDGYKYGVDCNKKDECPTCPLWEDCLKKQKELKKKKAVRK